MSEEDRTFKKNEFKSIMDDTKAEIVTFKEDIDNENNDIKATITFNDKSEYNFIIRDAYNVYAVVNCINTRYNYNH